jgi:hypothetical protein
MGWVPGDRAGGDSVWAPSQAAGGPKRYAERPGGAMVHDDTTYLDDEGLEYVALGGEDEESGSIIPVRLTTGGRLWGADEAYGGYDAE